MSKRKSEEQIIALLKRAEAGEPIVDLCRQEGIGVSTFYKWRSKYDGLEASELKRLKQIEQEHERLKKMYAELSLMSCMQEDVIDDFNREILGIDVGMSLPALRVTRFLNQLSEVYGYPERIRTDNGPEFTSQIFMQWQNDTAL